MSASETEQKAAKAGLDLGLGQLMVEKSESALNGSKELAATPTEPATVVEASKEAAPAAPLSPLAKLAAESKWGELALLAESVNSEDIVAQHEAKLYWVLSQLRQSSVPITILSAPLDSSTRALVESSSEQDPRVKKLAADLLTECGQILNSQGDTSLACILLERAAKFGTSAAHELGSAVESELKRLSKVRPSKAGEDPSKRIEELKSLKSRISSDLPQASIATARSTRSDSMRNATLVASILSLIVIGGALVWRLYPFQHVEVEPMETTTLTKAATLGEIALPTLQAISGLGNLDAVLYQLGSDRSASQSAQQVGVTARAPEAPAKKEVIDTSFPVRGSKNTAPPSAYREKPGSRNISQSSAQPTRRKRAPLPVDPEPIEIEEFNRVQNYVVEAKTEVMSKPSFGATPLDRIFEGDNIRAEARVGNWLKLRSKQGRIGYVSLDYVRQDADISSSTP